MARRYHARTTIAGAPVTRSRRWRARRRAVAEEVVGGDDDVGVAGPAALTSGLPAAGANASAGGDCGELGVLGDDVVRAVLPLAERITEQVVVAAVLGRVVLAADVRVVEVEVADVDAPTTGRRTRPDAGPRSRGSAPGPRLFHAA
ncbi:hypothetical protein [Nannocystis pusilla]|uniref:hypothetical protein n=1 Tax=Nannocystis pusilla TaxID=889268 RepID=UPI003DA572B5